MAKTIADRNSTTPKMGELWWANLGEYQDHLQGGVRPVLITSNDKNNFYSPNISYRALSSKVDKDSPAHTIIRANRENGLKRDSVVLTEQPRTISKDSLIKKIGELTKGQLERVAIDAVKQEPFYMLAFVNQNV